LAASTARLIIPLFIALAQFLAPSGRVYIVGELHTAMRDVVLGTSSRAIKGNLLNLEGPGRTWGAFLKIRDAATRFTEGRGAAGFFVAVMLPDYDAIDARQPR